MKRTLGFQFLRYTSIFNEKNNNTSQMQILLYQFFLKIIYSFCFDLQFNFLILFSFFHSFFCLKEMLGYLKFHAPRSV